MPISLTAPPSYELKPRIVVFGVGGAGGNAVNNMIESELQGVEFVVANTDAQALHRSKAERTIQMGATITQGLGAGARPEVGRESAEDSMQEIMQQLDGAHMVFITAGMGGGTGTGAAPVIAQAARENGILTVGVITKPFDFEGIRRMRIADEGVKTLESVVDTLIVIPNQNLFRVTNDKTTMSDAFAMADEVLHSGVHGITSLMVNPGLINLDFADVRTVMDQMGKAMMGTGEASGEQRAVDAGKAAIANPLLEDIAISGAKGVLINITGGDDLTMHEVDEAASLVRSQVDEEANIIIGTTYDASLNGSIQVSVVATGIGDAQPMQQPIPAHTIQVSETKAEEPLIAAKAAQEIAQPEPQPLPLAAETLKPVIEPEMTDLPTQQPILVEQDEQITDAPSKFGFNIFRPKRRPVGPPPAMVAAEEKPIEHPVAVEQPATPTIQTPDLFIDDIDDELEIPAFLRRQAN
ncbi:Cell division protein FtsZ [hydrothermal vent metagenome]|uniref:Cell division protein FtsZ n=1 Tax=hydrothermal vent metagenome TaxID=652676 RepID=A0A3B0T1U1_9ZZZZ